MNVYVLRGEEMAILDTLRGLQNKYRAKYCFPSHKTLLRLLREIHEVVISKRTLIRRLNDLDAEGFIYRIRRHTKGKFSSTVYYICDRIGSAVGQIKKIIGYAKRLRSFYPHRVPNGAHNRINTQSGDMQRTDKSVAAGLPESPQPDRDVLFKRGEAFLRSIGLKKPL